MPRPLKGWRTVKELAEELRFPSAKACREWLARNRIPSVRRGRFILVDGLDVDQVLRQQGQAWHEREILANRARLRVAKSGA